MSKGKKKYLSEALAKSVVLLEIQKSWNNVANDK